MRIRITLDITRSGRRDRDVEPIFEHRDNDTAIEATYGGDVSLHRMGFTPGPDDASPAPDPDLTAHRTRTNRRPEPQPHAKLVAAVDAVFGEPLEDKQ